MTIIFAIIVFILVYLTLGLGFSRICACYSKPEIDETAFIILLWFFLLLGAAFNHDFVSKYETRKEKERNQNTE